jgi:ketosteroid isomerase-like protein
MTNTPDQESRQQLVAYDKSYDEAMNKNDAVALAALYTKDAVLVNDTGVIYGREAIRLRTERLRRGINCRAKWLCARQNSQCGCYRRPPSR